MAEELRLALASATSTLGVALLSGTALRAEWIERDVRAHGERLLPAIARLLEACGEPQTRITGIALAIGPGTFTGLRVALATAKALAFGEGAPPVFPVSTLAALAANAGQPARARQSTIALLDARRGELYAGGFKRAGELQAAALPEGVYTPDALAQRVPRGALLVTGEGTAAAAADLCARRKDLQRTAGERELRAAIIGELSLRAKATDAADLAPNYLRRAAAEEASAAK